MRRIRSLRLILNIAVCMLLVTIACNASTPGVTSSATPTRAPVTLPTSTLTSTVQPTASVAETSIPLTDTGWEQVRQGLERRWLRLEDEETGRLLEQIFILRLQPDQFSFEIGYQPGEPIPLRDWQRQADALIVMNGGFFTPEFLATGLVVANGQSYGASYSGFGGMLAIGTEGISVRSLSTEAYRPDEQLSGALQAFPMLILPGGQLGYPDEDGQRSRRSVIGQDRDGNLVMIATNLGHFTLHQMANYLIATDLNLDRALNLDGGTSAGLLLNDPEDGIGAFIAFPTAIIVR